MRLLRFESLGSTQAEARRLAEEGAAAWTLVWALRQTAGRGRMERSWSSEPGGLYVSLILRPRAVPSDLPGYSLLFAEACAAAIMKETGLETAIKPPNDVLCRPKGGDWKKVCGILLEASGGSKSVDWLVAGIGINVDNPVPPALAEAGRLNAMAPRPVGIEALLEAVLDEIAKRLERP
jgi:BirA family biotin operon repressor/biotin-[acetyl-CoA-carboxylase] ligase